VSAVDVVGIDHVVLRVSKLDQALRFYREVLGCREERRLAPLGLVQLRAGTQLIDLIDAVGPLGKLGGPPPGQSGRNVDHVALRIATFDEAKIRAHLEAFGVAPGDVAMRYGAEGNGPSMYIQDPDGNIIELKGPPTS
jgi:glyoxylase I family protein